MPSLDYPVVEATKSILPLCDEVYVLVGSQRTIPWALCDPLALIKSALLNPSGMTPYAKSGRTLALETDKSLCPDSRRLRLVRLPFRLMK